MRFTRHRKAIRADADDVEVHVLTQLANELLAIIEPAEVSDDPLAALVGMPPGDVDPPDDPVLRRLLPAAYPDDRDAATEFRRYTDAELRAGKRQAAEAVLASLPDSGGRLELDREQADAWLTCLNDMRLALGTSLDVTEDTDFPEDPEDPTAAPLGIYHWLGWLQESLLSCVDPRPPT